MKKTILFIAIAFSLLTQSCTKEEITPNQVKEISYKVGDTYFDESCGIEAIIWEVDVSVWEGTKCTELWLYKLHGTTNMSFNYTYGSMYALYSPNGWHTIYDSSLSHERVTSAFLIHLQKTGLVNLINIKFWAEPNCIANSSFMESVYAQLINENKVNESSTNTNDMNLGFIMFKKINLFSK